MYVPVYINGELYYGTEPDGTTADGNSSSVPTTTSPTTTATKPATTTTAAEEVIYGDANCDGNVDISDAVMVKCYLINNKKFTLSKQGLLNSDVQGSGNGINAQDAVTIQKYVIKSITKLPV